MYGIRSYYMYKGGINMKNIITTLKLGDVVLFYDKIIKDDETTPGRKLAVLQPKLFIYQGDLPQGGGDVILQFANAEETLGMTTKAFLNKNCIILPRDQAPEVVKHGFDYVFAT